jgi:predicted MFS family arabinose efflux permease
VTVPISAWLIVVAWRKLPASGRAPNLPRLPLERLGLLALAVVAVAAAGQLHERLWQVALVLIALALMWFTFHRDHRAVGNLFPRGALDMRTQTGLAYWVVICVSISYATISLFMPLVLQRVHGVTPLFAGGFNMLMSIMWSIGAAAVAGTVGRRQRVSMVIGAAFMAIGAAGLAIGTAEAPTWVVAVFASFVGLGIGANNVILFNWVMSHASKGEETLTASSLPAIRSIGVAFGSALSGVIANSAGLTETADAASVARAVDWVYGFDVIPALLATALTVRLVTASRARAHDSPIR